MNVARESHYAGLPAEGGAASRCFMALEGVMWAGKRVLDVGCRRGKGVFKLSEQVGADGYVVGVDWRPDFVDTARKAAPAALQRSGLAISNMEFCLAFPEDLASAGIADDVFDAVYLNNGFTLFADPARVLRECARVLKPGGLLILECPLTGEAPSAAVLKEARAKGDSLAAARTRDEIEHWIVKAGFEEEGFEEPEPLDEGRCMVVIRRTRKERRP